MKNKTNKILTALGIIFCYLFLDVIGLIPLVILNVNTENLSTLFKMIYIISYEVLFLFMIYLIYKDDIKRNFKELIKNIGEVYIKYIPYWFLMIVLMYITNTILYVITDEIAQNEENVREIIDNYPIFAFILSVLIAPVMEELVFRKCIREMISNKKLYIVVSGLVFGFMHILACMSSIFDILYIISYSIPGFIFAYIYTKSDNIFSSIGLHMTHNFILVLIQLFI